VYHEEIVVSVLARHLGRAVRWTGDRLEDLASTSQGFDEIIDAELTVDRDGRILALAADVIGDVGAYSIYPWTATLEPVQVVIFMPRRPPCKNTPSTCSGSRRARTCSHKIASIPRANLRDPWLLYYLRSGKVPPSAVAAVTTTPAISPPRPGRRLPAVAVADRRQYN
jgi:hypothetical protein